MKELVGQGKPFHSALDKAAGLLKRKVGTGSEFLKELMSIPGVKQAEVAERGLGDLLNAPKMTHEQFLAALGAKPAPAIQEKVLGGDQDDPNWIGPYHYQYSLPGGENYREMLIKAPKPQYGQDKIMELEAKLRRAPPDKVEHYTALLNKMKKVSGQNEQFSGVPQHFGGEPGILASMRLKDREGPNGEKLLHLEELQSDWHQQGRERGYKDPTEEQATEAETNRIAKQRRELVDKLIAYEKVHGHISPEMQQQWNQFKEIEDAHRQTAKDVRNRLPDAPFKKNWEEMALKRLIHHAAENGYHGIVVTPGDEQAERYSLAKHLDALHYNPDTNRLIGKKNGRILLDGAWVPPEKLESHVGKDLAKKIMEQEPNVNGLRSLIGEDLVVGGEGMKGFYDKKVPSILNSIGKKHGVKTQPHGHQIKINEGMLEPNPGGGYTQTPPETKSLHYFPITEEMRQDVKKNGIPLYESGGSVSTQ